MSFSLSLFNFVVSGAVPTTSETNAELLLLSPCNTMGKKTLNLIFQILNKEFSEFCYECSWTHYGIFTLIWCRCHSQSLQQSFLPSSKALISENLPHLAISYFLLSDTLFINSLLIAYTCQMNIILADPISEIFTTFSLRLFISSLLHPLKENGVILTFKRYPSEEYNYSEDSTTLYEMWYTVLRATLKKLIIVAIMCLTQFTQLCDWQKLPKQNSIKYNSDSHKTSLPLL